MARIETLTLNGVRQQCFNVCEVVGVPPVATNNKGDVMVVQAMFQNIADILGFGWLNLSSKADVPDVNGHFDLNTKKALLGYQHKWKPTLIAEDGLIHPASYKGRDISFGAPGQVLMTITRLHHDLVTRVIPKGTDYTTFFQKIWPELIPWLKGC
jgi:hypothetical protein